MKYSATKGEMMQPKAVIFDFGRVLATFDHMKTCRALTPFSPYPAEEIYQRIFKSGIEQGFDEGKLTPSDFFRKVQTAIAAPALTEEAFAPLWGDIFIPHVEVLQILQKVRVPMYLLSNTNIWHWPYFKDLPVITRFFSEPKQRVLSFEVGARKPSERIFEEAQRRTDRPMSALVYVDDLIEYVEAARGHGMQGLQFDCTKQSYEDLGKGLQKFGIMA